MYECRKCKLLVSAQDYAANKFCPQCGTLLQLQSQAKHWLFQFNPLIYRWIDRIKETNEPEQWLVSQYAKQIKKDDLVAIWSAGQNSGIYALGQILTNPAKKPLNPNQEKYFIDKNGITKFLEKPSAIVTYLKIIADKPIPQDQCHKEPALLDLNVFINPRGTNFPINPQQWNRIIELTA
jgi:5-methylcytosine-specific restriction protein B